MSSNPIQILDVFPYLFAYIILWLSYPSELMSCLIFIWDNEQTPVQIFLSIVKQIELKKTYRLLIRLKLAKLHWS